MSTEQIVKLSDQKKAWEKLITTPEWASLMTMLQAQVDVFQQRILFVPLTKLEDALPQEYMKGQIEGRLSLTNTIETLIEGLENELSSLRGNHERSE